MIAMRSFLTERSLVVVWRVLILLLVATLAGELAVLRLAAVWFLRLPSVTKFRTRVPNLPFRAGKPGTAHC
jgi:hypothetical protein